MGFKPFKRVCEATEKRSGSVFAESAAQNPKKRRERREAAVRESAGFLDSGRRSLPRERELL